MIQADILAVGIAWVKVFVIASGAGIVAVNISAAVGGVVAVGVVACGVVCSRARIEPVYVSMTPFACLTVELFEKFSIIIIHKKILLDFVCQGGYNINAP